MAAARLSLFNSPRKAFCTCPPKYNINPYLGRCSHGCIYCYALKFPSFNGAIQPRTDLISSIEAAVKNTKIKLPVMLSDCTDPYQPLEEKFKLTRKCLTILAKYSFPILIVTKSDMVVRDIDILKNTKSVVSVTVTTLNESLAKIIEPYAPSPERRIKALQRICQAGIPAIARVDPIIPGLNDDGGEFESLISTLKLAGVKQITISTLKPVKGFFHRFEDVDRKFHREISRMYASSQRIMGYKYLPLEVRHRIIKKLKAIVEENNLPFASCREGLSELNHTLCDGTAFCRTRYQSTLLAAYDR